MLSKMHEGSYDADIQIYNREDESTRTISFDLLNHIERKKCCDLMFKSLFASNKSITIESGNVGAGFHILGVEIILNKKKLKYALKHFSTPRNLLNVSQIGNFFEFIASINENKLQIKFILSRQYLWKPYIKSILLNSETYPGLWLDLISTVVYWKKHHYLFSFENGLKDAIISLTEQYYDDHYDQIATIYKTQRKLANTKLFWFKMLNSCYSSGGIRKCFELQKFGCFYNTFKRYAIATNIDQIYDEFANLMQREYKNKYISISSMDIYKRFYYKQIQNFIGWNDRYRKDIIIAKHERLSKRYCAYIHCKNRLRICGKCSPKPYICKCKLVTYCCRNHQKKDWKMLHRYQCLQKR